MSARVYNKTNRRAALKPGMTEDGRTRLLSELLLSYHSAVRAYSLADAFTQTLRCER